MTCSKIRGRFVPCDQVFEAARNVLAPVSHTAILGLGLFKYMEVGTHVDSPTRVGWKNTFVWPTMVVHFLKIIEWLNVNNNHNKKLKSLEGKRRVLAVDALLLSLAAFAATFQCCDFLLSPTTMQSLRQRQLAVQTRNFLYPGAGRFTTHWNFCMAKLDGRLCNPPWWVTPPMM